MVPVKPFADPPGCELSIEVEEFVSEKASLCSTFDYFLNNLYVYPLSLKYDNQKLFAKVCYKQQTRNMLLSFICFKCNCGFVCFLRKIISFEVVPLLKGSMILLR